MLSTHLNKKMFDLEPDLAPIRKGFGEGLLAAGEADEKVVGLCADLTESTQMHLFANKFPTRFVEMGVAEQNLASVASGMSAMGKMPFITSYAMFSPGRNWEQIRTTICYNDRPVVIVGSHAGISVGPDGGTHQAVEDLAITRVIPNMIVLSPCDSIEAKKATLAAAKAGKPVYLRLAREKTPIMTTEKTPFEIGKAEIYFQDKKNPSVVGIIATGALLHKALAVATKLKKQKIYCTVMNLATIKPLDEAAIIALAKETKKIVTIEEHQIAGGMGSAVAECLSKNYPVKIEMIGVKDVFGQSGKMDELLAHYKMDEKSIEGAVLKILKKK
jgi:transketolase